jgi:NTP pyrophosphatase (non-canonical NTP hydrolase)
MKMTFDEYQKQAITTNLKKDDQLQELMQQVLGLGDEAGEVLAIFKKWIRDNGADITLLDKQNVAKELGDILWYIAVVAHDLDISFDDIASKNIEKLQSRKQRGTLTGSGDNR